LAVRVGGRGIADYTNMTIEDAIKAFDQVKLDKRSEQIAGLICKRFRAGCAFSKQWAWDT
jgi:excinuclease UvrABC ATPase subunit